MACQGKDARALNVVGFQPPTVLLDALVAGEHREAVLRTANLFQPRLFAAEIALEPNGEVHAVRLHPLAKATLRRDLHLVFGLAWQPQTVVAGIDHEQIDGLARHAGRPVLDVAFDGHGRKPFDGRFLDASNQGVVDRVVNFVNDPANQVVAAQHAQLVLDVVVVQTVGRRHRRGAPHHAHHPSVLLVRQQQLRGRLVHIHLPVRHQPPHPVTQHHEGHQHPPVLPHQLDVGGQIFQTQERLLGAFCHLWAKVTDKPTPCAPSQQPFPPSPCLPASVV